MSLAGALAADVPTIQRCADLERLLWIARKDNERFVKAIRHHVEKCPRSTRELIQALERAGYGNRFSLSQSATPTTPEEGTR